MWPVCIWESKHIYSRFMHLRRVVTSKLFYPKYRLVHPEFYLLSFSKQIFSGSKYPINVMFDFKNRSTGCDIYRIVQCSRGSTGMQVMPRRQNGPGQKLRTLDLEAGSVTMHVPSDTGIWTTCWRKTGLATRMTTLLSRWLFLTMVKCPQSVRSSVSPLHLSYLMIIQTHLNIMNQSGVPKSIRFMISRYICIRYTYSVGVDTPVENKSIWSTKKHFCGGFVLHRSIRTRLTVFGLSESIRCTETLLYWGLLYRGAYASCSVKRIDRSSTGIGIIKRKPWLGVAFRDRTACRQWSVCSVCSYRALPHDIPKAGRSTRLLWGGHK